MYEPPVAAPSPHPAGPSRNGTVSPAPPAPRPACLPAPLGPRPRLSTDWILRHGADAATDADLLTTVLCAGEGEPAAAAAARLLLGRFRTLRRLAAASPREVRAAGRLSEGAAARVAAAFALGRRAAAGRWEKGEPFRASADIFERYHPALRDARKERFLAVLLDGKNRVLRDERISEGSLTSSLVHPREVFAPAIRESASALVFVHNHPSGDPEPSPEDVDVTRRLCAVGELIGIRVLDHVVIGDGAFVSFLDRGLISP
jgi:DNA repair protein RadC